MLKKPFLSLLFIVFLFSLFVPSEAFCAKASSSKAEKTSPIDQLFPPADNGDPKAQYNLGLIFYQGTLTKQDYKEALYWFTRAAKQNHNLAQYSLGIMYSEGQGVIQDYEQAFHWFEESAKQGNTKAKYNLGVLYSKGSGVRKNYRKAIEIYKEAALEGNVNAIHNIAVMYHNGRGVERNFVEAYAWARVAEKKGLTQASDVKERAAKNISPNMVQTAERLADEYYALYKNPVKRKQEKVQPPSSSASSDSSDQSDTNSHPLNED